jgi:hypothetical protein
VNEIPPEEIEPQADFAFFASLIIIGTVAAWVAVAVVGIVAL